MKKELKIFRVIVYLFLTAITFSIFVENVSAQPDFTAKTDFSAGTNPQSIAYADFNGDGKPDLVTANSGAATASVFLNTTTTGALTPSFSAKTDFSTGGFAISVSAGDINCDGKQDFIVVNLNLSTASVFLNTTTTGASTPTFSAKTDFTVGNGAVSINIKDVNNNGKPDIICANQTANTISVLLNTTTTGAAIPTFSAKTDFSGSTLVNSVSTGDLNGDGKQDMAVANFTAGTVSVFLNTTTVGAASPTFSAKTDFTAGSSPTSVAIGDINSDGKLDLIVTNGGSASVSIFINTMATGAATPVFSAKTDFSTPNIPRCVTVADLNFDGLPDIITANQTGNSTSAFLNTTTPGAATPTFAARVNFSTGINSAPYGVTVCDLNSDGKPDIAAANQNANTVSVFLNITPLGATPATFSALTNFTATSITFQPVAGDFNLDGKPDIAVTDNSLGKLFVLTNTTTPGSGSPNFTITNITTASSPAGCLTADINLDGKADIALTNSTNLAIYLNTTTTGSASPTFSAGTNLTTLSVPAFITSGDFNKDGKPDLACSYTGFSTVSVFLNTTTPGAATPTFSAKTDLTTSSVARFLCTADFNGDGKPDIAAPQSGTSSVGIFLNTTTPGAATPTFSARTDFSVGTSPLGLSTGDLNSDGKADFVCINSTAATFSVLLNTTTPGASTATFAAKIDFSTGSNYKGITMNDLNGDGLIDLIYGSSVTGNCSISLNTTTPGSSTPSFSSRIDLANNDGVYFPVIGDFNIDGKKDIAINNDGFTGLSVYINTTPIPLPVELSSFTASVQNQNVKLDWSTVQEINNKGFEIERSSFGETWKKIGYEEGHGTTNQTQNYSYRDNGLTTGSYKYRLKQIDYNGNFEYHELNSEVIIGVPAKYALAQNYPNPFNPSTIINYQLAINSFVTLKIYDISGREVSSLVNEVKEAGYYSVQFDAKNLSGGTYFYKLTTDKFSDVKKMMVVK